MRHFVCFLKLARGAVFTQEFQTTIVESRDEAVSKETDTILGGGKIMRTLAFVVLLFVTLWSNGAFAQETRSTLTGRVTDPSGAILPNVPIIITNLNTGIRTMVRSNNVGEYTAPFLLPGTYEMTVTVNGFSKYLHTGLVLQTEQTVTENIVLSIGSVDLTVTVTSSAPLVDTATATTGQVLTAEEVEDLPNNGRSPLGYAHFEYGAIAKGKHSESQVTPFGNQTADDFSLGGGNSASNELLLNGVPNMQDSSRTAGFSPQLDAVDAVRVDEFSANAAMGDTAGGVVNITTKAGANTYHGSASEYYSGSRPFTAKPYFTPAGNIVASTHFNQFGGTIGGPVRIPHLFNGRDKLFFFYAFEGYIGNAPSTLITSVPTQAERNGDFSALLAYNSSNQLYNPYNATQTTSKGQTVITRQKIPGNIFSNAGLSVNPAAAAYFAKIPMPNYNGASTKADGENNYFTDDPTTNNYKSNQLRMDYTIVPSNTITFEVHRSNYLNSQSDYFHNILSGTKSQVILWGGQVDDVQSFSPTLNLESRLGFSRYYTAANPSSSGIDPATMSFPSYISSNSTKLALPAINFSDNASTTNLSGIFGSSEAFNNIQFFASLNKTWGHHAIKIGPDIRANKLSQLSPGAANGQFGFKSAANDFVTSSNQSTGAAQPFGGAFALFALGLPTTGATCSSGGTVSCYSINTKFQFDNFYFAGFAQDDWKVLPNLTISMGLRIDHETPVVESNNNMSNGWDRTLTNAVTAPAAAAYAAAPNAALPVSAFSATGGITYATSSNRSPYSTAPVYVSPRLGFAYSPGFSNGKLAIRGGAGIYVNPFGDYYTGTTYGYSQTSFVVNTTNSMLSPATTLSDPFPVAGNPIQQPTKSSLGVNTQLGSSVSFYAPVKVPYSEKASLDIQQQFGKNLLVEVGYLFDHQIHNSYSNQISSTPVLPYLSRLPGPDAAVQAFLSNTTPNPFYGILPGPSTSLNTSKTISVQNLLQAYPQYTSVTDALVPGGSANFNALLFRVSRQMSAGVQFNLNYEHSRQLGNTIQLNNGGPLWYGETSSDFPDHLSLTGIWQLPIGRGRRFLHDSRLLDELIGGYSLTTIYQYLSGTPLQWSTNVNYSGNFGGFSNNPHKTSGPSFNTAGFATASSQQPNAYNYRTFPEYLLRSDPTKNFDFSIMKDFVIYDRLMVQPRFDAFNAFNRPQFSSANLNPTSSSFGYVTSQLNTGRQLQAGIHILF